MGIWQLSLALVHGSVASPPSHSDSTWAAISIVDKLNGTKRAIGHVTKHPASPFFSESEKWEPRIDNGYPNVVPPEHEGDAYKLWYGAITYGHFRQLLLFANSTDDGLNWVKPHLGIFDLDEANICVAPHEDCAGVGTANNIVLEGGGIGVFRDDHEEDPSRRYKAIGPACWTAKTKADCGWLEDPPPPGRHFTGQKAVSADGLIWTDAVNLSFPPLQKWDTHNNAFYDPRSERYIFTSRSTPTLDDGHNVRATSIGVTPSSTWDFDTSEPMLVTNNGSYDHQAYAQVTWPWLNTYLGISMMFDANDPDQRIHCRLMWSDSARSDDWQWVQGGLTGPDFIPLGGGVDQCSEWSPVSIAAQDLSDCDAYRSGQRPSPAHRVCTGEKTKTLAGEIPLAACREACSADSTCAVMQWQGQEQHGFAEASPGQCFFLSSCDQEEAYDSELAPSFCMQTEACKRVSEPAFDSHICFAAASPHTLGGVERVYYMGGDGPHSGERRSSFALATLRRNGYASVRGTGTMTTLKLLCTGPTLTVTVDFDEHYKQGSLQIGIVEASSAVSVEKSIPLSQNATDALVQFQGGADFTQLIGSEVSFEVRFDHAILYTIGFVASEDEIFV